MQFTKLAMSAEVMMQGGVLSANLNKSEKTKKILGRWEIFRYLANDAARFPWT
jgi:hypothetical protein